MALMCEEFWVKAATCALPLPSDMRQSPWRADLALHMRLAALHLVLLCLLGHAVPVRELAAGHASAIGHPGSFWPLPKHGRAGVGACAV